MIIFHFTKNTSFLLDELNVEDYLRTGKKDLNIFIKFYIV